MPLCRGQFSILPEQLFFERRLIRTDAFFNLSSRLVRVLLLLLQRRDLLLLRVGCKADHRLREPARIVPAALLDRVKVRRELVVFALRERIVFVVVAPAAIEREPEPHRARRLHAILHIVHPRLLRDAPAFAIDHVVPVKARRDKLLVLRLRQQVAGDLLDRKFVEWHVRVERRNRPVAPEPHRASRVALIAVRVRIPRRLQPLPHHAFAVARRREQLVHKRLDCSLRFARRRFQKCVELLRRRRQSREVEVKPSAKFFRRSLGRRRKLLLREPREHESINGIITHRPVPIAQFRTASLHTEH